MIMLATRRILSIVALLAVGFLGVCAILLGSFRLVRSRERDTPPAISD